MIPSDHFVRFYNEVFKFLDERNELEKYYLHISKHQELHCLELFKKKGLQGVYEYYQKIYKEENCQGKVEVKGHELTLLMSKCPSLSKAIDNDAGVCRKYCLHCPGWTIPIYTQAGLYQVYDTMGLEKAQCREWIYDEKELAVAKYKELLKTCPEENIVINFDVI